MLVYYSLKILPIPHARAQTYTCTQHTQKTHKHARTHTRAHTQHTHSCDTHTHTHTHTHTETDRDTDTHIECSSTYAYYLFLSLPLSLSLSRSLSLARCTLSHLSSTYIFIHDTHSNKFLKIPTCNAPPSRRLASIKHASASFSTSSCIIINFISIFHRWYANIYYEATINARPPQEYGYCVCVCVCVCVRA
jgi:hypothetical protein